MTIRYSFPIKMRDYPDSFFCIYAAASKLALETLDGSPISNESRTVELLLSNIEKKLAGHGFSAYSTDIGGKWQNFNRRNSIDTSCLIPLVKEVYINESTSEYQITFDGESLAQCELTGLESALTVANIMEAEFDGGVVLVQLAVDTENIFLNDRLDDCDLSGLSPDFESKPSNGEDSEKFNCLLCGAKGNHNYESGQNGGLNDNDWADYCESLECESCNHSESITGVIDGGGCVERQGEWDSFESIN